MLALGIVVRAVVDNGFGQRRFGPPSLRQLIARAARDRFCWQRFWPMWSTTCRPCWVLVPIAAASGGPGPLLAVLLGVNVGPNLTYVGSLATLLWRRVLQKDGEEPAVAEFSKFGVVAVPVTFGGIGHQSLGRACR